MESERRWPLCDKCGKPVRPHNNLYHFALATGELRGIGVLLCQNRHLLPEGDCLGSPSRAQYLEGQPRDARGYEYDPARETTYREARRVVLAVSEDVLADGLISDWMPTEEPRP